MSAEAPASVAELLLRRTWRQWWLAWPKWFRIGAWALVGLFLLHVAFLIRMAIGLRELTPITRFRERTYDMKYFWEPDGDDSEPFEGHDLVMSGLWGRTGGNIGSVTLLPDATDGDLAFLGGHCRNIRWLGADYSSATSAGLKALRPCRRLMSIALVDANLTDDSMELLLSFPELDSLDLCGTEITDAAIPVLNRLPNLNYVDLSFTEVSSAGAEKCRAVFNPEDLDRELRARIRWSDGLFETRYVGETTLTFAPRGRGKSGVSRSMSTTSANRRILGGEMTGWVHELHQSLTDGDYIFQLTLGKYESAPFVVAFQDGNPSTHVVEFLMPVKHAEAVKPVATFAIRWTDGQSDWPRSEYWGWVKIVSLTDPSNELNLPISMNPNDHFRFEWEKLIGFRDGDYQFVLYLKHCHSAPVTVTLQSGRPIIERIEFQMPCTRAEALK